MSLEDHFPDKLKDDFAKKGINYGSAILVKIPEFKLSYEKYVILLNKGVDEKLISFVVNNTNKGLEHLSLKIKSKEYNFLKYDSWIDCSRLHHEHIHKLISFLKANPENALGNIDVDLLSQIDRRIKSSPTISKSEKRRFNFI